MSTTINIFAVLGIICFGCICSVVIVRLIERMLKSIAVFNDEQDS